MNVITDEVWVIECDSKYDEFADNDPHRRCDMCGSILSVMYELVSGDIVLCLECYEAWDGNPEWLDLIALVTEATNVPR